MDEETYKSMKKHRDNFLGGMEVLNADDIPMFDVEGLSKLERKKKAQEMHRKVQLIAVPIITMARELMVSKPGLSASEAFAFAEDFHNHCNMYEAETLKHIEKDEAEIEARKPKLVTN